MSLDNKVDTEKLPHINKRYLPPTIANEVTMPMPEMQIVPLIEKVFQERKRDEITEKLRLKRESVKPLQERLKRRWQILEKKEEKLQNTFEMYDAFVRRNIVKRQRAEQKLHDHIWQRERYERDIAQLKEMCEFYKTVIAKMESENGKLAIFENFLDAIVKKSSTPFRSISMVIRRYEDLMAVKEICIKRQKKLLHEAVNFQEENVKVLEERREVAIELKNKLTALYNNYDKVCRESIEWDIIVTKMITKFNEMRYQVDSVVTMIDSVYESVDERLRKIPMYEEAKDLTSKMYAIKETLKMLKNVQEKAADGTSSHKHIKNRK